MKNARGPFALGIVGVHLALLGGFVAAQSGIRINISSSVPPGVYRVVDETPASGDYVAVCPPATGPIELALERGYLPAGGCEAGTRELIKVLAATEGDHVSVTDDGVAINGTVWPDSVPLTADLAGRPLPKLGRLDLLLSASEVVVLSQDCPTGFDSRYFGPLPAGSITGVARPLLLW